MNIQRIKYQSNKHMQIWHLAVERRSYSNTLVALNVGKRVNLTMWRILSLSGAKKKILVNGSMQFGETISLDLNVPGECFRYCIPMTEIEFTIMPPEEWFLNDCGSGDSMCLSIGQLLCRYSQLILSGVGHCFAWQVRGLRCQGAYGRHSLLDHPTLCDRTVLRVFK